MHNLRRYYYQNKYKIWGVIAFIVLLLLIIQVLNKISAVLNEYKINEAMSNNANNTGDTIIKNQNTDSYVTSDKSSVTGEKVETSSLEKASKTIESFVSACNNGNIEQAYNLISEDCKEELYPNINTFKTLYYDTIFGKEKKSVSIENWLLNTYKVNITEDIMTTGNANGMRTQDYITIVKDGENIKLNINSLVKKEEINKTETIENIKVTVISKNVYMDYEEYDIKVENQTDGKILLDSKQDTKSIYVQDDNGMEYYAYSNEILSTLLRVNKGFSTQLAIKFFKSYSNDRTTRTIVFSDVTLNYNENISEESNKKTIKINL